MIDKSNTIHYVGKTVGCSVLISAVVWVILIVAGARQLRSIGTDGIYEVVFGPLQLVTLTNETVSEGVKISIALEQGLLWYVVIWTAAGLVAGLMGSYWLRKNRHY